MVLMEPALVAMVEAEAEGIPIHLEVQPVEMV
jgi:hypothetical protein